MHLKLPFSYPVFRLAGLPVKIKTSLPVTPITKSTGLMIGIKSISSSPRQRRGATNLI